MDDSVWRIMSAWVKNKPYRGVDTMKATLKTAWDEPSEDSLKVAVAQGLHHLRDTFKNDCDHMEKC